MHGKLMQRDKIPSAGNIWLSQSHTTFNEEGQPDRRTPVLALLAFTLPNDGWTENEAPSAGADFWSAAHIIQYIQAVYDNATGTDFGEPFNAPSSDLGSWNSFVQWSLVTLADL